MSKNIFRFTFVLIVICSACFAQKKFKTTIKWPDGLVTDKMNVSYYNGVKDTVIEPVIDKNEITISDNFTSKYATISVTLGTNNYRIPVNNKFYVTEKPATIIFKYSKASDSKYKTTNAYYTGQIDEKYITYIASAKNEFEAHFKMVKMGDLKYYTLLRNLILKKLEFIRQYRNSYYAFQAFKNEIAPIQFATQDSLVDSFMDFYKINIPQDIQNSPEGIELERKLQAKFIVDHDNVKAPEFTAIDILGNTIRLQDLRDRYIIINFLSSSCSPCIAELPAIRQIREKYPEDQLTMISVLFEENLDDLLTFIKKHKMSWINIYNDEEFASSYGGIQAIPRLFLIDKKGMIIYNRFSGKETDYVNLRVLNEVLVKEFGK
jgi:thiol-disulfide isomerase/thioredoxin